MVDILPGYYKAKEVPFGSRINRFNGTELESIVLTQPKFTTEVDDVVVQQRISQLKKIRKGTTDCAKSLFTPVVFAMSKRQLEREPS
jgi:hypothetical protein